MTTGSSWLHLAALPASADAFGWFAASAAGVHLMQVQTLLAVKLCNVHATPGHVDLAG